MNFCRYMVLMVVAMTVLALLPSPTLADPGLRVTNPKLETDVSPGEVISHTMSVGIRETAVSYTHLRCLLYTSASPRDRS